MNQSRDHGRRDPFAPPAPPGAGQRSQWQGLHAGAAGLAVARAAAAHHGLTVLIARDTSSAQRWLREIEFYDPDLERLQFPDWETLAYDAFSPHQDIVSERLTTLMALRAFPQQARGGSVLVVPVRTLLAAGGAEVVRRRPRHAPRGGPALRHRRRAQAPGSRRLRRRRHRHRPRRVRRPRLAHGHLSHGLGVSGAGGPVRRGDRESAHVRSGVAADGGASPAHQPAARPGVPLRRRRDRPFQGPLAQHVQRRRAPGQRLPGRESPHSAERRRVLPAVLLRPAREPVRLPACRHRVRGGPGHRRGGRPVPHRCGPTLRESAPRRGAADSTPGRSVSAAGRAARGPEPMRPGAARPAGTARRDLRQRTGAERRGEPPRPRIPPRR